MRGEAKMGDGGAVNQAAFDHEPAESALGAAQHQETQKFEAILADNPALYPKTIKGRAKTRPIMRPTGGGTIPRKRF